MNNAFFGENVKFWIGKIVSFEDQRDQVAGESWGYRYKVRVLGDYSNKDSVEDKSVFVAQVLVPPTAGTGAAGRIETVKLSQGDIVLGIFLGPDRTSPFILNAFIRTQDAQKLMGGKDKFSIETGYDKELKKLVGTGLLEKQEFSQTDLPNTPLLKEQANKGTGKGRKSPLGGLANLAGGLSKINSVGAFGKLSAGIKIAKKFF
tara:strand:- start:561 stop:1172 length:612 start_codon:yes stop_codon:yes gene_type:complete